MPVVVKADGLAAGKGVLICATRSEAQAAVDAILVNQCFGTAGKKVVVEEFLDGEEAVVESIPGGVIPSVLVRTAAGRTRRVRTIDLEALPG